jgi:hypothetical protein
MYNVTESLQMNHVILLSTILPVLVFVVTERILRKRRRGRLNMDQKSKPQWHRYQHKPKICIDD